MAEAGHPRLAHGAAAPVVPGSAPAPGCTSTRPRGLSPKKMRLQAGGCFDKSGARRARSPARMMDHRGRRPTSARSFAEALQVFRFRRDVFRQSLEGTGQIAGEIMARGLFFSRLEASSRSNAARTSADLLIRRRRVSFSKSARSRWPLTHLSMADGRASTRCGRIFLRGNRTTRRSFRERRQCLGALTVPASRSSLRRWTMRLAISKTISSRSNRRWLPARKSEGAMFFTRSAWTLSW
jgi:hypothetical protein